MGAFGIVVVAVLVVSLIVGLVAARKPAPWDEIGSGGLGSGPPGGRPPGSADEPRVAATPPSRADDEADLRELLALKRAARRAREGLPPEDPAAAPERPLAQGPPWAHMESELVEEARALVARRRERLARQGKPDIDERAELERILGPPHA